MTDKVERQQNEDFLKQIGVPENTPVFTKSRSSRMWSSNKIYPLGWFDTEHKQVWVEVHSGVAKSVPYVNHALVADIAVIQFNDRWYFPNAR